MSALISQQVGFAILLIYGLGMIVLSVVIGRGKGRNKSDFLLANRDVGVFTGALSIAASWIWAPALFISSQKAYQQGLSGLFWFTFPNVLSLIVFAPLALKIRKIFPLGYTLPEFMKKKHGSGVHVLYLIQFIGLQVCSFAIQILAGASLIQSITGISFYYVALIITILAVIYSSIGGLRASVATDVLQMLLIFIVLVVIIPWAIDSAGGFAVVKEGLQGVDAKFTGIFDPWVAYSFGIPATISLISGPIGDQQHWQRAFALKNDRDVLKTFFLSALFFVVVPLSLSLLGFIAANPSVSGSWGAIDAEMVGPTAVANLLPRLAMIPFCIMLLSGLCSTLDSALCATSSLASIDIFHKTSELGQVKVARISMVLLASFALGVSFIPGLKILHLWLFYGTWRASTMVPTIFSLYLKDLNSKAVFWAILLSFIFGAPIYAAGAILKNPHLSVSGSLLVVGIGFSGCLCCRRES